MTSLDELLAGKVVLATVVDSVQKDGGFAVISVEVDGTKFDNLSHYSPQVVGSKHRVNLSTVGALKSIKFV